MCGGPSHTSGPLPGDVRRRDRQAGHPSLAAAGDQALGLLLDAITQCQEAGIVPGRDPFQVAAPLWSLVHGVASLAIGGELQAALGIEQDPEAIVGDVVTRALGSAEEAWRCRV